jgi:hypothetical protein
MPKDATVQDWDYLTGLLGRDRGIIFELFNDPVLPANSTDARRHLLPMRVGADAHQLHFVYQRLPRAVFPAGIRQRFR